MVFRHPRRTFRRSLSSTARRSQAATVIQRARRRQSISKLRLAPTVGKLVQRKINRSEPTKFVMYDMGQGWIEQAGAIDAGDWKPLLPNISQGTKRIEREGSKVKILTMTVSGWLRLIPSDTAGEFDNLLARIFIAQNKNESDDFTTLSAQLLRGNQDLPQPYNGTVTNHNFPVNRSIVHLYGQKSYRLVSNRYQLVTGGLSNTYGVERDIRLIPFFFKLRVKNKIIRYKDSTETLPVEFNPRIAFGLCNLNDPAVVMNESGHVKMLYQTKVRFKDA